MNSKKSSGKAKSAGKRRLKDLPAGKGQDVKGGNISNIMKTKHETVKNTLSNVR